MRIWMTAILTSLFSHSPLAEPLVIYDNGSGISTRTYTQLFSGVDIPDFRESWLFNELPSKKKAVPPKSFFPLKTKKLTPARIEQERERYFPKMLFPICIIGTDELSLTWIEQNRVRLAEMNAQCLLVSAASKEAAAPILALAKGLLVYPADGDAVADYFQLDHYPVLITERYISQ